MSMKLLIISDAWHPQVNGVVRTYEYLCRELEKNGYQVDVISPSNFAITMPMPFYPEIKLAIKPYKRLKRLIKDYNPDRIHIATEGPLGWAARKFCLKNKIVFTTCYHTQFPDYVAKRFAWLIPSLYDRVHKLAIKSVRNFHAPSAAIMVATKSLEKQLLDWKFLTPIKPLTRGVDTSIFFPADKKIFKDLKAPIALYVGRIAIEKNLEEFLKMDWDGSKVLVGDGPIRQELENKYPHALFVGKKTGQELADHYRSSDVFVFPSKTDTFGIVLIEALACGLPIAAYDVMGPKDIITESYMGELSDDLSKAAKSATKLSDKNKLYEHVKNNYSWEKASKQFIDAI